MTFDLHYKKPFWTWFIVGVGGAITLGAWVLAVIRKRGVSWNLFSSIALTIGLVLAVFLGDLNFRFNMSRYYDIANLQVYEDVKPDVDKGSSLMDAGKVYFASGTTLDNTRGVGFKNGDVYCVAPIVKDTMTDYDFWAVGKNCCADRADFRCGEYANRRARAGLRMMDDEDRPFYRLAVVEATNADSANPMPAPHPLFFYWMQDPLAAQNAYRDDGFKFFLIAIFSHFAFNLLCVIVATIAFAKIGSRY
uniref:Uncharacterized protein n=1 Tax=Chromera velia CCMP2878 TaxID=1169474 RepID=A0A0G4IAK2_9ALVE|eukprot:Cvel_12593.t1-p1 / transcript=Cvel_12593.t1 / gene=Cvel_12593 / organism=Chromera_velia_CCMP2878 / gene_product=hypothetical protein / transcript_product=hypothetical protein / location=Cvel_scaffold830:61739-62482(+) / protein_length=248 / sequence_SO=supercontig / SO=protein_coding / is_pseudo=false